MSLKTPLLKIGIIGYGKVGRIRHECVKKHPDLTLLGICDIDTKACNNTEINFYDDYKKLLDAGPDVVFVCTYNCFIPEIAIQAISRGIHVFTEKPPGRTLEDVKAIQNAALLHPEVKVKFGFNHRYHEAVIEAKTIVDSGRLGEIMWIRGTYGKAGGPGYDTIWRNIRETSGGGILIDQGIHMLDLFRYFCGEFDEVKSFIERLYWPIEVEDNVFAILRNSRTRKIAMLHSSATQWRHKFLMEIYLKKGYLEINGILSSTQTYGRETLKIARCLYDAKGYPLHNPQENMIYFDNDNSWNDEIDEFLKCIIEDKPVSNGNVDDAVKIMDLVQNIYMADKNGFAGENI